MTEKNIRTLYFAVNLADKISAPLRNINKSTEDLKRQMTAAISPLQQQTAMWGFFNRQVRDAEIVASHQSKTIGEISVQLNRASMRVREYASSVSSNFREANLYIKEHADTLGLMGAEIGAAGYAGLHAISEGVNEAAMVQDTHDSLYRSLGDQTDEFLAQMREASGGMLTEADIIKKANLAQTMGIDLQKLPSMVKMARASMRRFGGDMDYYYDSIVVGTARQSRMILDNLGIIVSLTDAQQKYAESVGKTVSQLTDEEKRMAFQQAVMEAGETQISQVDWTQQSYNESLQQASATMKEVQAALGEGLLPVLSVLFRVVKFGADLFLALPKPIKIILGLALTAASIIAVVTGALFIQGWAIQTLTASTGGLSGAIAITTGAYRRFGMMLLGNLIPAEAIAAFSTGGLTAGMYALAGSIWATLAPLLPVIAAVGVAVGAFLILQDLVVKGWDDSHLKRWLDDLCERLPWLQGLIDTVVGAFKGLYDILMLVWGAIQPVLNAVGDAMENPAVQWGIKMIGLLNPATAPLAIASMIGDAQKSSQAVAETSSRATEVVSTSMATKQVNSKTEVQVNLNGVKMDRMSDTELADYLERNGDSLGRWFDRRQNREFLSAGV